MLLQGGYVMITSYDYAPLFRSSVGFDWIFSLGKAHTGRGRFAVFMEVRRSLPS